jgi:hypothetical protein
MDVHIIKRPPIAAQTLCMFWTDTAEDLRRFEALEVRKVDHGFHVVGILPKDRETRLATRPTFASAYQLANTWGWQYDLPVIEGEQQ